MERKYKIKNVDGLEYYRITKSGKLYNNITKNEIKPKIVNGYEIVNIGSKNHTLHRLVALTFLDNPENKPYVDHIDSNKLNNNVKNLRWATQKENCNYHGKKIDHPRKVIQLDANTGEVLNTYNSLIEAGEAVGVVPSTISKVLIGKNQTGGGFKWKYENQEDERDELDISQSKPVDGFPKYVVFKDGRVYNINRSKLVKPVKNANGHCYVSLCHQGRKRNKYIHTLVGELFLENPNNYKYVLHKNGIKDDNKVENLVWCKSSVLKK